MKRLLTYLLLLAPLLTLAQQKTAVSVKKNSASGNTPVLVDDVLTTMQAMEATVKPEEILEVTIQKYEAADQHMAHDTIKAKMIVYTEQYAVKQYQQKLSSFSNQYRLWLSGNGNDDKLFRYYIDGEELPKNKAAKGKLFGLKKEYIESVVIERDFVFTDDHAAKVKILTKK